jgi:hypothetical protein
MDIFHQPLKTQFFDSLYCICSMRLVIWILFFNSLKSLNIISNGSILLGQDVGFPLLDVRKVYLVDDG